MLGGERRCARCRELTKLHEEVIRGKLSELAHYYDESEPRGEYVVVVEGAADPAGGGEMTLEQAAELARSLAAGGMKLSDACKEAAKAAGVSKRELYSILSEENN